MALDTDIADIQIREASLDDVIGIVYVQATSWIESYTSEENGIAEDDIRSIDFKNKIINWQHLIRSPNYNVWVAAKEDKIIGVIAVLKEAGFGEIYEQAMLPDYRQRGLGTKLWEQAAGWLADLPVKVRIISYHEPSAAFYKKLGFEVSTLGEVDFIALPSGKNIPTIEMRRGQFPEPVESTPPTEENEPQLKDEVEGQSTPSLPSYRQLVGRAELARISSVRASTIKYYTEIGILPFQQAETRLARRYHRQQALDRLQEIQQLRQQGLSIKEIANRLQ